MEGINKILYAPGPRTPQKTGPDPPASDEALLWRHGSAVAPHRGKAPDAAVLGGALWHKPSWGLPLTLPYSQWTPGLAE